MIQNQIILNIMFKVLKKPNFLLIAWYSLKNKENLVNMFEKDLKTKSLIYLRIIIKILRKLI